MPSILVRKLTADWDTVQGHGAADFLTDLDAVAQIILSTILLLQGEWFLDTTIGTPVFQQLLSHPITNPAVALIFQNIILGVPYVTGITQVNVTFNPSARGFSYSATVSTQFGTLIVTG